MNSTMHWPSQLSLRQHPEYPGLYTLVVRYGSCDADQYIQRVHICDELQDSLRGPNVGFQLMALPLGQAASSRLPSGPSYAVVGTMQPDGKTQFALPSPWRAYRQKSLVVAAGALLAGGLALAAPPLLGISLAFGAGAVFVWSWSQAKSVTVKPFHVVTSVGP